MKQSSASDENARLQVLVDRIFTDLETKGDIAFTESKAYVVGYVCRELKRELNFDRNLDSVKVARTPKKPKRYYDDEVAKLLLMIDIAVEASRCIDDDYKDFAASQRTDLNEYRQRIQHVPPENRNLRWINMIKREMLAYYNDASGEREVKALWKRMEEEGLGFERRDDVALVLKRGRIINKHEMYRVHVTYMDQWEAGCITDAQKRKVERLFNAYW